MSKWCLAPMQTTTYIYLYAYILNLLDGRQAVKNKITRSHVIFVYTACSCLSLLILRDV